MNTNNKKHPEFLELNTTRNIGIVTIKQMERIELAITRLTVVLLLSLAVLWVLQ